tara:strand:+ start:533 stop:997 length:465 start_codon:yes stop_codon:yes gene_type:complete
MGIKILEEANQICGSERVYVAVHPYPLGILPHEGASGWQLHMDGLFAQTIDPIVCFSEERAIEAEMVHISALHPQGDRYFLATFGGFPRPLIGWDESADLLRRFEAMEYILCGSYLGTNGEKRCIDLLEENLNSRVDSLRVDKSLCLHLTRSFF